VRSATRGGDKRRLSSIAEETLAILASGSYTTPSGSTIDFGAEQRRAVAGTQLYTPGQCQSLLHTRPTRAADDTRIDVTDETTQAAAARLVLSGRCSDVGVLNFASARSPGGGFLKGAKAQEEDLARCSGLYPCLLTQETFYAINRHHDSLLYTDHIIFSRDVPWFRVRSDEPPDALFLASVITAPAPNAGQILRRDPSGWPAIEACLRRRAGLVLAVARDQSIRSLVLGAWGCGVFGNQAAMVADAFGRWLETDVFRSAFQQVVFAVRDRTADRSILGAFRDRFLF